MELSIGSLCAASSSVGISEVVTDVWLAKPWCVNKREGLCFGDFCSLDLGDAVHSVCLS